MWLRVVGRRRSKRTIVMRNYFSMRFVLLTFIPIGFSSSNALTQTTNKLKWLEGTWVQHSNAFVTTESWAFANGSLMGKSETKSGEEVVFAEVLRIHDTLNTTFYEARLPIKTGIFKLDSIGNNYVSFTDPTNDFPSKLSYFRKDDALEVILEGTNHGDFVKERLNFVSQKK
jgi:hypothetical protein